MISHLLRNVEIVWGEGSIDPRIVSAARHARAGLDWFGGRLQKHRKIVAVAFSLILHVAFVLFLLARQPTEWSGNGFAGQGTSPGDGIAITLVDGEKLARMTLTTKAPSEETFEPTGTSLQIDAANNAVLASPESNVLPQLVQETEPSNQPTKANAEISAEAGLNSAGNGDVADNDLWSAIAPCWYRLADNNTSTVTLNVSFDENGNIASPPTIASNTANQSNVQVRRAEVIAMQALAQCGAYSMADGRENVTINFPKPQ